MPMNVKPVPTLDNQINDIRLATAEIVNNEILPNEGRLWGVVSDSANAPNEAARDAKALRREIQEKVKLASLWAPHLPREFGGMGLNFLQHAYMNEVLPTALVLRPCSGSLRRTPATRRFSCSTEHRSSTSSG